MFFYVRYTKPSARMSGFTLIELMITVVIVAVLASIALPSYTGYVARARRADARTQLLQVAQFMQRFYAANDSYQQDRALPIPNPVIDQIPSNLKSSPDTGNKLYDLSLPLGVAPLTNAMSFTVRMVPVSPGAMANDECGTFTFTSTGVRGVIVGESVGSATLRDKCWK